MFNPAPKILKYTEEVINHDHVSCQILKLVELINECDNLGQIDQVRDVKTLLLQQSTCSSVATKVSDDGRPSLLEHVAEQLNHFILQDKLLLHLS
jgi:hypothetical protein